jgi:hypothetical protein
VKNQEKPVLKTPLTDSGSRVEYFLAPETEGAPGTKTPQQRTLKQNKIDS